MTPDWVVVVIWIVGVYSGMNAESNNKWLRYSAIGFGLLMAILWAIVKIVTDGDHGHAM